MSQINYGAIATEWNRGGARRALAELKRQGYVIVPVEPTAEARLAGSQAIPGGATLTWEAMVALGEVVP